MERWMFMGRSMLPYEVERTLRRDFPSTGWSTSWPRREKPESGVESCYQNHGQK